MSTQNLGRAALQGLGMGWGDEGEAWLRSKLGEDYEDALKRIRQEYGQYSKENPWKSGLAELAGGVIPGVLTGGATTGASTMGTIARQGALGAATGAVSGAGAAEEGDRGWGAVVGGGLGGALGVAIPAVMRGAGAASRWIDERKAAYGMLDDAPNATFAEKMASTPSAVKNKAAALLTDATKKADIDAVMAADRAANVPSVIANVSPATSKLARGVAKMGGEASDKIEDTLMSQRLGTRERVYEQANKALKPGNYYDDLQSLQDEMEKLSAPAYAKARAFGEVTDPTVLSFLTRPQFIQGLKEAERSAAVLGDTVDLSRPTVDMLDRAKKGIDTLIERETDPVTGKVSAHGRDLVIAKKDFLKELDRVVPDYELARGIWGGGAELKDAMNKGLNQFKTMDHEQVAKLVAKMGDAEKKAFRTGVARDLYSKIMDPVGEMNAAEKIFKPPELQQKMRPLFNSDGEFKLFKAAMEREAQLFRHSNRILGGSDTAENLALRETIKGDSGVGKTLGSAVFGDFKTGLSGMVMGVVNSTKMTDKTASRLADMLMAKDPHEVAAVVKLLENYAAEQAPKAVKSGMRQAGAITAATGALPAPPAGNITQPNIDDATETDDIMARLLKEGPNIDD